MEVRQRPRCESMAFGVLEFSGPENHVIFHWIYEVVHRFMIAKLGIVTSFFTMSLGFTTLKITTIFHDYLVGKELLYY